MKRRNFTPCLFFFFFAFYACAPNKGTVEYFRKIKSQTKTVAWNEDAGNPCILVLTHKGRFVYTIVRENKQLKDTIRYYGKYHYKGDTLWMRYDKKKMPWQFKNYLIKETGGFLNQSFWNDSARIYMRILGIRSRSGFF